MSQLAMTVELPLLKENLACLAKKVLEVTGRDQYTRKYSYQNNTVHEITGRGVCVHCATNVIAFGWKLVYEYTLVLISLVGHCHTGQIENSTTFFSCRHLYGSMVYHMFTLDSFHSHYFMFCLSQSRSGQTSSVHNAKLS